MKTTNLVYHSKKQCENFIREIDIIDKENILIQVFTSQNNYIFIQELINMLKKILPQAKIIGTTTCGEISPNGVLEYSTIISFSVFENTKLKTTFQTFDNDSLELGKKIANDLLDDDLSLIITFTDGLNTNGEEYLKGIESTTEVIIAGGMAGDNSEFVETFVFNEESITNEGAVAVGLYNKDLKISTQYSFNWQKIGRQHIVTKSDKNVVYEIDGDLTPVEFYRKYLGDDIADKLPAIGIEFPLIIQKDNVNIARAILRKNDDDSLVFAGNIEEGSKVVFGYGDVSLILKDSLNTVQKLNNKPIESFFIYSCMARKYLLKQEINVELLPLKELAPISGFFTYGEFYNNGRKNNLLNQTMTILGISESSNIKHIDEVSFKYNNQVNLDNIQRTKALSHLVATTTHELEELNRELERRVEEEVKKSLEKDALMQINARHAQMGEMLGMILHQWRQPLSALTSGISSLQVYKELGMLDDEKLDEALNNFLVYVDHLNQTIEDFRNFFRHNTEKEFIKPSTIVNKLDLLLKSLITKHNVDYQKIFEYDEEILVNNGEISQVLLNIIKNAVDAIEENKIEEPKIILRVYSDGKYCIFDIEDNGGGIPEDILPKIFDKRFTTKGNTHGTGIGLDMSKVMIEQHMNGKIIAYNRNNGAVFEIKIPI